MEWITTITVRHYGEEWTVSFNDPTTTEAVRICLELLIAAGHSRDNVEEAAGEYRLNENDHE